MTRIEAIRLIEYVLTLAHALNHRGESLAPCLHLLATVPLVNTDVYDRVQYAIKSIEKMPLLTTPL